LTFQFALTGWEGSAHDGVLRDAVTKEFKLTLYYYLGDAGYALKPNYKVFINI
jgi:hypothetical protein